MHLWSVAPNYRYVYNSVELNEIRNKMKGLLPSSVFIVSVDELKEHKLLREPGPEITVQGEKSYRKRKCRRRCERRRKRGKQTGIRTRLMANPTRPALPSLFLANVHSLDNKMDFLRLRMVALCEVRDCCDFIFTEMWLHDNIPAPMYNWTD